MRSRVGRSEREARKRHRRVWVGGKHRNLHASFRYFLHFPEAESTPLKLGRKHYARMWLATLTETVTDSRKEAK